MQNQTRTEVLIVEENLKSNLAHFCNFVDGITAVLTRKGMRVTVAAHQQWRGSLKDAEVLRLFKYHNGERFLMAKGGVQRVCAAVWHNLVLAVRVAGVLWRRPRVNLVVATYINVFHVFGWWLVWAVFGRWKIERLVLNSPCPVWVFDFKPDGTKYRHSGAGMVGWCYRLFRRAVARGDVLLLSETEHDAAELSAAAGVEVRAFDPPRLESMVAAARAIREQGSAPGAAMIFGWVGQFKVEKGVSCFMEGTRIFLQDNPTIPCRIRVPWPDDPSICEVSLAELEAWAASDERIEWFHRGPVGEDDDYGETLGRTDCIILPYQKHRYIGRGSSTALDGAVAEVPLIVTGETWMDDLLRTLAAGIAFENGNANALAAAMRRMYDEQAYFRSEARRRGEVARERLSWTRLAGLLTGESDELAGKPDQAGKASR